MAGGGSPSDAEHLEAIRRHAHDSMRYHATAAIRSENEDRDLALAYLDTIANVMALVEGDDLDERHLVETRSEIAARYLEAARTSPWTGPCSCCGESPTVAWFEGPHFTRFVGTAEDVRSEEAWTACAPCLELVLAGDRDGLASRGADRFASRGTKPDESIEFARHAHEGFWSARDRA
jgi:hypothetical protein